MAADDDVIDVVLLGVVEDGAGRPSGLDGGLDLGRRPRAGLLGWSLASAQSDSPRSTARSNASGS